MILVEVFDRYILKKTILNDVFTCKKLFIKFLLITIIQEGNSRVFCVNLVNSLKVIK